MSAVLILVLVLVSLTFFAYLGLTTVVGWVVYSLHPIHLSARAEEEHLFQQQAVLAVLSIFVQRQGGSSRLVTCACDRLCKVPTAKLHFFAICKPCKHPSVTCFGFTGGVHGKRPVRVCGRNSVCHSFACISSVIANVRGVLYGPPGRGRLNSHCGVCGVNGRGPRRLVRFVRILRGTLNGATRGRCLPVRPNSICRACTSIDRLRHSFSFGPRAPVRSKLKGFTR